MKGGRSWLLREGEGGGGGSAEEPKVTLTAAHLAADCGQYVIYVPPGQLCDRTTSNTLLHAALVSCEQHIDIQGV